MLLDDEEKRYVKTTHVKGRRVSYIDTEKGQPLVLFHSWPMSKEIYLPALPILAQKCMVIIPDYPGFGDSEYLKYGQKLNYDSLTDNLADFLTTLMFRILI